MMMMTTKMIVIKVTMVEGVAKFIHVLVCLLPVETQPHSQTNIPAGPCQPTAMSRWTSRRTPRPPPTGCPSDPPPSACTSLRKVWTNEQMEKVYLLPLLSEDRQKAILFILT